MKRQIAFILVFLLVTVAQAQQPDPNAPTLKVEEIDWHPVTQPDRFLDLEEQGERKAELSLLLRNTGKKTIKRVVWALAFVDVSQEPGSPEAVIDGPFLVVSDVYVMPESTTRLKVTFRYSPLPKTVKPLPVIDGITWVDGTFWKRSNDKYH